MKYDDAVPPGLLLLRFVVTRYCNYRCPYCYVPGEKAGRKKSMFSHKRPAKWAEALDRFRDRHLELYFTGGEPTLVDEFLVFLEEMVGKDFVRAVRIDSNVSRVAPLLERVRSPKVKFLASFHPSHVPLDRFLATVETLRDLDMLGMANIVASKENVDILGTPPHELADRFEERGCFLNVAKDFHRGVRYGYDPVYREYIDLLQHPLDNESMNRRNLTTGKLCGTGKHYVSLNRHGDVYSCGGIPHGNLFDGSLTLPPSLVPCREAYCPSIISYSFSSANEFSPAEHLADYVRRNRTHRMGLEGGRLSRLWEDIRRNDRMPREGRVEETSPRMREDGGRTFAKSLRKILTGR